MGLAARQCILCSNQRRRRRADAAIRDGVGTARHHGQFSCPGIHTTDLVREGRSEHEVDDLIKTISERSMVGRVGDPDDIANAVAFLVAPNSGFVTARQSLSMEAEWTTSAILNSRTAGSRT